MRIITRKHCLPLKAILLIRSMALLLLGIWQTTLLASEMPFTRSNSVFSYNLYEQALPAFLAQFFVDNGVHLVLSARLKKDQRSLNGPRKGTPNQILHSILTSNGLVSYFDSQAAYIYYADELRHEYMAVPKSRRNVFKRAIGELNWVDDTNNTKQDSETGILEVSGVPRYVEQIKQLVDVVAQLAPEKTVFRYLPLKYAWVSDRTYTAGERQVTVPGVANMLRQLIHGESYRTGSDLSLSNDVGSVRHQKSSTFGSAGYSKGNPNKPNPLVELADGKVVGVYRGQADSNNSKQSVDPYSEDGPSVVADSFHNAVIIRDVPERIAMYEELIRLFDIPTRIVEIEATIIDIDTEKMQDIGVQWRYGSSDKKRELMFGKGGSKTDFVTALAGGNVEFLDQVPGFQVGAIIGDANRFMARVNALESDGALKLTSRPKVATLNDIEAIIESSRSLFVPVEGAFETDLFEVFSGTILRVTPHVIDDDLETRIRLIIAVEDGNVELMSSAQGGQNIPVSTRNAVHTQAIVNEGHSLLLGGLEREVETSSTSKVPLLGDIPILGNLFRFDSERKQQLQRMYLISPRLIMPDGIPTENNAGMDGQNSDVLLSASPHCINDCREEDGSHKRATY